MNSYSATLTIKYHKAENILFLHVTGFHEKDTNAAMLQEYCPNLVFDTYLTRMKSVWFFNKN